MCKVPPIEIAGRTVSDPLGVLADYCRRHADTLRRYDWLAGTTDTLTVEQVAATRRVNSRISRAEERWLLDQAVDASWAKVSAKALLREANPLVRGGLYDDADALYRHFHRARPTGVNHAKISKCLYLMRPGLIPVLDSRLLRLYGEPARAAARDLTGTYRRAYWAAIRNDLLRNGDAWDLLRAGMRCVDPDGWIVAEAADRLSDLRLLDILAWRMAATHHPDGPGQSKSA